MAWSGVDGRRNDRRQRQSSSPACRAAAGPQPVAADCSRNGLTSAGKSFKTSFGCELADRLEQCRHSLEQGAQSRCGLGRRLDHDLAARLAPNRSCEKSSRTSPEAGIAATADVALARDSMRRSSGFNGHARSHIAIRGRGETAGSRDSSPASIISSNGSATSSSMDANRRRSASSSATLPVDATASSAAGSYSF